MPDHRRPCPLDHLGRFHLQRFRRRRFWLHRQRQARLARIRTPSIERHAHRWLVDQRTRLWPAALEAQCVVDIGKVVIPAGIGERHRRRNDALQRPRFYFIVIRRHAHPRSRMRCSDHSPAFGILPSPADNTSSKKSGVPQPNLPLVEPGRLIAERGKRGRGRVKRT
jgi:hypothetical protein